MHWGYEWGMGGFGWIFMIVFWVLVVLGVVYLLKLISGADKGKKDETPLDILKKRYAKGEITKEEYDKIKDDIKAG
ncbi:MAG: SHOCT domain-containing protein [Nitrospirota bacterium]